MMTFPFNGDTAQVGQNLTCTKSYSPYFIEGKTYPVVKHHRYDHPVIVDEVGSELKWTKSEFCLAYQLQQRPIKLHQVWQAKSGESLVRITKVTDTCVEYEYFHHYIRATNLWGARNTAGFYKDFIFIF